MSFIRRWPDDLKLLETIKPEYDKMPDWAFEPPGEYYCYPSDENLLLIIRQSIDDAREFTENDIIESLDIQSEGELRAKLKESIPHLYYLIINAQDGEDVIWIELLKNLVGNRTKFLTSEF
jgi:hypothetical protein